MINELALSLRSHVVSPVTDVVQEVRRRVGSNGKTLPESDAATRNVSRSESSLAPPPVNPQWAVEQWRVLTQQIERELRFSINESSGKVVIRVVDAGTGNLVRQIPADEVMALLANYSNTKGTLFGGSV